MPNSVSKSDQTLGNTLKFNKLSLLSIIVLSFSLLIVFLDDNYEEDILSEHHQTMTQYLLNLKKEKIADIVESFIVTVDTVNQHTIELAKKKLQAQINVASELIKQSPETQWCSLIDGLANGSTNDLSTNNKRIHYRISSDDKIICQSTLVDNSAISTYEWQHLTEKSQLTHQKTLSLTYSQAAIAESIKPIVIQLVNETSFKNPDIYLWINEIHDFSGGDNYATRIAHANLKSTVGQLLSTNTKDINGNRPYHEELEGINQKGYAYLQYSFQKKSSDHITKKLSYVKLYPPLNWVIATGVYVGDIEASVTNVISSMVDDFTQHNIILLMTTISLSLILIYLLHRLERKSIKFSEHQLTLKYKTQEIKNYRQVLNSILDLVEQRDSYTAGHTKRVAQYSTLIAKAMKLPKKEIKLLHEAAMMHDIGKTSTPDAILLKPGKLTLQEYKIIQHHLDSGYAILSSIKAFRKHADVMRDHHEYYNGKGYPRGRKGNEISTLSHILILADAFDAMTSKRIYRESKSLTQTLEEIKNLKGIQFCPEVVDIALPVLAKVKLAETHHNYLSNEFEQARLAYHYKDPLTGLYNYKYLKHVLSINQEFFHRQFCCGHFLSINNFSLYNQKYGWLKGDEKLIDIAKTINTFMPNTTGFRVLGDDFLILSEEPINIDEKVFLASLDLETGMLDANFQHFKLDKTAENYTEYLATKINSFIGI